MTGSPGWDTGGGAGMDEAGRARWRRVEALLDAALDLEPAERAPFLARACAGEDALRGEVERLLRSCESAGTFLEEPAIEYAAALLEGAPPGAEEADPSSSQDPLTGLRIGPYRVVRELGRGGMGAVYLAERADGEYSKRVALKIIRPDARAGGEVLRRFRAERQILASLEHPNLARLLDGGATAQGVPYFAMEHVDGERIDRFCDARRLSIDERLRLFLSLCDAVSYAHQQGVLHRDIKPSNVLVTREGAVKLLDFGIAKLVTPGDEGDRTLTAAGVQPLTPEYASPEQLRGDVVGPGTDVYALGVLLFQLLTGEHPRRLAADGSGPASGGASVEWPPEPAAAVLEATRSGGAAGARSTLARATTPSRLRRRLRGDLGAVVMQALRADPAERYASVADMATDLRRELEGLPVRARRRSWPARALKTLRRSPAAVGAAAAAVLLLLGALALLRPASAGPAQAAPRPGAGAPAELALAVLPFSNVGGDPRQEYLSDGLTDELLDALARLPALNLVARSSSFALKGKELPAQEAGRRLHASHLLEGSVQRDGRRVRISVQLVEAGSGYRVWSGRYDRNFDDLFALEDEIGRAVAGSLSATLQAATEGGVRPLVRTATTSPQAHEDYLKGEFFLARHRAPDLRKALHYFRRALASDSAYAPAWAGLGQAYGWLADVFVAPDSAYPLSEAALRRALALDPTLPGVHLDLGWVYVFYKRDWKSALAEFKKEDEIDPTTPHFLWLSMQGRLAEAIPDAERARRRSPLSPMSLDLTAWVYVYAHQYEKAIQRAREALEIDSAYFYGDSPLAQAYLGQGRFPEAIAIYEKERAREGGFPPPPLVMAYARAGRMPEARRAMSALRAGLRSHVADAGEVAGAWAYLGERDSAFAWLERGLARHAAGLAYLRIAPWYDPLRSDARFPGVLRGAGF